MRELGRHVSLFPVASRKKGSPCSGHADLGGQCSHLGHGDMQAPGHCFKLGPWFCNGQGLGGGVAMAPITIESSADARSLVSHLRLCWYSNSQADPRAILIWVAWASTGSMVISRPEVLLLLWVMSGSTALLHLGSVMMSSVRSLFRI